MKMELHWKIFNFIANNYKDVLT